MDPAALLAKKAIKEMNKKITDEIFQIIQTDRELMKEYSRLIESEGVDKVNQIIGKTVKKEYNLINSDEREDNPRSTLIQSHQKFN